MSKIRTSKTKMVQMSIGRNVENESLHKGKSSTPSPSLVCPTPHPHFMLSTFLFSTFSPFDIFAFDQIRVNRQNVEKQDVEKQIVEKQNVETKNGEKKKLKERLSKMSSNKFLSTGDPLRASTLSSTFVILTL